MLPRPRRLQRIAVHDHVAGLVPEPRELARVGVGGTEPAIHERPQLLAMRAPRELRAIRVVGGEECRVVGVDDQHSHSGKD